MTDGRSLSLDWQQRRWVTLLTASAALIHIAAGVSGFLSGDLFQVAQDAVVTVLMLGVLVMNLRGRLLTERVYRLVVYVLSARTAGDLLQNMVGGVQSGPLLHVQLLLVMSLLLAFLPFVQAAWIVAALYALLVAAALLSGEVDVLLLLAMVLAFGVIRFALLYSNAMVESRLQRERLAAQLARDPLTGAWSRSAVEAALQAAFRTGDRTQHLVLMVDVDHFKEVNDTYGHAAGDELLCALVQALQGAVRAGDQVGRWGGEEFIVLLRDVPPAFRARGVERVLQAVRILGVEGLPDVTVSVGLAALDEGDSVEAVVALADRRLYEAKAGGRDRAVLA